MEAPLTGTRDGSVWGQNGGRWRVTREEGCEELGRVIGKQNGALQQQTSALMTSVTDRPWS